MIPFVITVSAGDNGDNLDGASADTVMTKGVITSALYLVIT